MTAKRDRWKRGVRLLDNNIGEALGEAYVGQVLPAREQGQDGEPRSATSTPRLESRLEAPGLDGRADHAPKPCKKLGNFEVRVGYPNKWRDYSAMQVDKAKLFENVMAARTFEWNRQVARMNGPVDREEWGMNAQTVNASYNPLMNQITFPAGILQPPFFDVNADPAVNYGAIGAVIGHEIGHGFDDQGARSTTTGVQRDWWTAETKAKFKSEDRCAASQYDSYCPFPGACIKRRAHHGREHRRPRRHDHGLHRLQAVAERPACSGHRGERRRNTPAISASSCPGPRSGVRWRVKTWRVSC